MCLEPALSSKLAAQFYTPALLQLWVINPLHLALIILKPVRTQTLPHIYPLISLYFS